MRDKVCSARPSSRALSSVRGAAYSVLAGRKAHTTEALSAGSRSTYELLENRLLLSAYAPTQLGQLGINASGANPRSTLVADSSGNWYGTTSNGGTDGDGTVFEIAKGSTTITTLATFNGTNGATPYAGVTLDSTGDLFGTTEQGGADNDGTVFEIAKSPNNGISTLATFTGANGQYPYAGLTLDGSGNLFGTTYQGGSAVGGTVFEIAKGSATLTTVASFGTNYLNGEFIKGGVAIDSNGNLFGTTEVAGADNVGTIFKIAAGSNVISTLATFNNTNGTDPATGVVLDASGNLYGTTNRGGATGYGSVFELPKGSSTISTLVSFDATYGGSPVNGLILDSSGNLFGTTNGGGPTSGGTVYEIASGTSTLNTLVSLNALTGNRPEANLTLDASGHLFGTAYYGGAAGTGTVFEVAKGASSAKSVANFDGTNASEPNGSLVLDRSGNLYGTTLLGGPFGDGTVFEIPCGSTSLSILASFNGTNGEIPFGGLTSDGAGNLYGTTQLGGAYGYGTVFEVATGSSTITTLASFKFSQGASPEVGVTLDAAGDLFGTTQSGGANQAGAVFEIAKGSNAITVIASLPALDFDAGGVALDASGNIYATTKGGGTSNDGTVYEIAKGSNSITTLASFSGANGQSPEGALTFDPSGNLYGLTVNGGADNEGVVFEIPEGSTTLTTVATLTTTVGIYPPALYSDASGNLYDTSNGGGAYGRGNVFEIPHGSSTPISLFSFNGTNGGALPASGVTPDGLGNFYATTSQGGAGNPGTIYKFSANTGMTLAATGPNPAGANQPLSFSATMSGGVPDGQSVQLVDTSNANAVVASGTLSGGTATLSIPANTLRAGTHNLIAVYAGNATFAASESASYAQTVLVAVTGVAVNGNKSALAGVQRSMVDSILYTFSEAVNMSGTAATIAVHSGQSGTLPTSLIWTAINPNIDGSSSQWAVSFSGAGVVGNSIANGVYDISLNASAVTSDANASASVQARPTDTFYRLFGDINGDGVVNAADNFQLKTALATYNAAFDYNADGAVNAADNFQFKASQPYNFAASGIVYTI